MNPSGGTRPGKNTLHSAKPASSLPTTLPREKLGKSDKQSRHSADIFTVRSPGPAIRAGYGAGLAVRREAKAGGRRSLRAAGAAAGGGHGRCRAHARWNAGQAEIIAADWEEEEEEGSPRLCRM